MRGERATMGKSLLDVQRELKIRATYIAAIENADPTAFETPGFIAGYVRSYARYLELDPEWAYKKFCAEGNFAVAHGLDKAASSARVSTEKTAKKPRNADPLANPNASFVPRSPATFGHVEPGAIGSVLVLVALVSALGFGGWSVLKEIQKVRLTPVENAPGLLAQVDPLNDMAIVAEAAPVVEGQEQPGADALARLYRPRPLDVPVMVARDGPISTLEPGQLSALDEQPQMAAALPPASDILDAPVQVVDADVPEVVLFAVRPAWVRVAAADGTVVFEKILDAGETYVLPATEEPPVLRTGNGGAVYFAVNGQTYGPAGVGGEVVKNVVMAADALTGQYQVADVTENAELARVVAQLSQPAGQ
ncbi:helix-turn-helix domain-containing protein [Actibacterium sp. XHP0104]|nr:helix-turn-helix domain-containing protein [Actibacterium sp. XHP0104]MCV2880779.1 helix-turn-helix domain-containing protein [Actibacterium sp. XHP0104]